MILKLVSLNKTELESLKGISVILNEDIVNESGKVLKKKSSTGNLVEMDINSKKVTVSFGKRRHDVDVQSVQLLDSNAKRNELAKELKELRLNESILIKGINTSVGVSIIVHGGLFHYIYSKWEGELQTFTVNHDSDSNDLDEVYKDLANKIAEYIKTYTSEKIEKMVIQCSKL